MNSLLSNFQEGGPRRREHTVLWWVILGLGMVFIIVFNLFSGDSTLFQWFITILLCIFMTMYWYLAYRNVHVSQDTKGDGIYYLGLFFTFAALVAALIKFTGNAPQENVTSLIANFGIALVTTIFGLAGRVGFSMGQESAGDITADAVNALENAVDLMKRQAIRSGAALESIVGHLETTTKVWQDTVDKISGTAEAVGDSCDEFTLITKNLAGGVHEFQQATKEIVSSVQGIAKDMGDSASEMSMPMHDVSKRIARLNEECDKFNEVLQEARQTLQTLDADRFAGGISGFEKTVQDVSSRVSSLRIPLEETGAAISDFGSKAGMGSGAFDNLANAGQRIGRVGANLTDFSDALDRLQASLQQISRNGAETSKGIADAGEAIHNMYATAEHAAEPLRQAAADASQLSETVGDLQGKTEGLRIDLERAGPVSKDIRVNLEAMHARKFWKRLFGRFRRRSKPD